MRCVPFRVPPENDDDLLKSLCQEIFDHVFSDDLDKEKTHDFSQNHGPGDQIRHILYHLQEHMDYLSGILSGDGGDIFMDFFKAYLVEFISLVVSPSFCKNHLL